MPKHFSSFLARRYLVPRGLFIVIINLISVIGVTLAVGVLIVVLSVMKGFENEFRESLLGFDPHIYLTRMIPDAPSGGSIEPAHVEAARIAREVPGVTGASPFVQGPVLLTFQDRIKAAGVKAIRADDEQLQELEARGMFDPEDPEAGELNLEPIWTEDAVYERVIVSRSVADGFRASRYGPGLRVGDIITAHSLVDLESSIEALEKNAALPPEEQKSYRDVLEEVSAPPELYVTGIIDSPLYQDFVLTSLNVGQELFNLDETDEVHGIAVFAEDPYHILEVQKAIDARLPRDELGMPVWQSMNWAQRNQGRLDALRLERRLVAVLMNCIMLVAGFCIMNTTIVTTMQKRREIGIMKAMGARVAQIIRVFVLQSFIVGLIGTGVGLVLGMGTLFFLEPIREFLANFGADPFPVETYGLTKIPAEIIPLTIILICGNAVLACTLASVLPAWVVARMDAARALRSV